MTPRGRRLPDGFTIRIRADVRRHGDKGVLVGGSPLRVVRLSARARELFEGDRLEVKNATGRAVAERLLDANLADPDLAGPGPADITVVIPVRDRPDQLDHALAAVHPLPCIVVDDASHDPAAVATVAARHGARLVTLVENVGPAGARNAGLRHVPTQFVAFVDSDVRVDAATLGRLARHFADPAVALAGPLVQSRARSSRPRWFERYDEQASSLALGTTPGSVHPGAAVGWLPSACLVGRVAHLGAGFDPAMRVGEDVDLVWRLVARGHVVRYEPQETAYHDARPTIGSWLGRKFVYGTGSAGLAARHGTAVAPAVIPPVAAVGAAAVLLHRRWSWPVAAASLISSQVRLKRVLPDIPGRGGLATRLAVRGLGWSVRQESALLVRHSWPAAAALALVSKPVRRAVLAGLLVDVAVQVSELRRPIPPSWLLARQLDNLAYGAGLWVGALRSRSPRSLLPRFTRKDGAASGNGVSP
ncbi:mycofactocin biosynthesis glycosyltransferase MftF [Streptomyces cavernae]|uniref:mycofactocin biosynthesis glycosyltransferase MftF n=1 Tax=Streptomyces cavernae TaxID=2259034 RepID=UPI000FEBEB46|nr:mycofactocin biosynthesis glycosyltransferase MftF [Streptomyces cavernae]